MISVVTNHKKSLMGTHVILQRKRLLYLAYIVIASSLADCCFDKASLPQLHDFTQFNVPEKIKLAIYTVWNVRNPVSSLYTVLNDAEIE